MSVIAAIIAVLFMSLHFTPIISLNSSILSRGIAFGRSSGWMIWNVGTKETAVTKRCRFWCGVVEFVVRADGGRSY